MQNEKDPKDLPGESQADERKPEDPGKPGPGTLGETTGPGAPEPPPPPDPGETTGPGL